MLLWYKHRGQRHTRTGDKFVVDGAGVLRVSDENARDVAYCVIVTELVSRGTRGRELKRNGGNVIDML